MFSFVVVPVNKDMLTRKIDEGYMRGDRLSPEPTPRVSNDWTYSIYNIQ